MVKYKLTHFKGSRGRAEAIRLLFAAAGVEFEDFRITREDFRPLKQTGEYTYGQLPVLEIDDIMITQTYAIERYLANLFGFVGADEWEAAKIDAVSEQLRDLTQKMMLAFFATPEEKAAKVKHTLTYDMPHYLLQLEHEAATSQQGYLVGSKPSVADIRFFAAWEHLVLLSPPELKAQLPNLQKVASNVASIPGVQQWIQNRPSDTAAAGHKH